MIPQTDWLIEACGKDVIETSVAAGEFLFRLGELPHDIFLVVAGEARARRYGADGAEIVMQRARAGEFLAEAGMVAPRYSCEGFCPIDSNIRRIPLATLNRLIRANSDFALRFSQFLALSMRRQCARYERLRLKRAGDRVLHYLNCELVGAAGAALELDIPLADWADDLGLEPATLYRTLADLERKGFIAREPRGRKIRFLAATGGCIS
jgi:CRP-like cAMP-binding protein